jgi:hypothetical protein
VLTKSTAGSWLAMLALCAFGMATGTAAEKGWLDLTASLDAFKAPTDAWQRVGSVSLNPDNPRRLVGKEGKEAWFNGPEGRARNLITRENFGDAEAHVEFLLARGSNAGVKFNGQYEIQIYDSFGKTELSGADCGGIYPRAEHKPKYHHIDKGVSPKVNACKAPGEWQTLDIVFQAPRFDAAGKKTANTRFVKVVLNGVVIHENVEVLYPTGAAWVDKEMAAGPLLLQGDHGPVAFRNVRIRSMK